MDERSETVLHTLIQSTIGRRCVANSITITPAFQTAVALAEYRFSQKPNKSKHDAPTLDQKDFEQVCDMTRQFKQYLTDVHGVDEDGRAFLSKARVN